MVENLNANAYLSMENVSVSWYAMDYRTNTAIAWLQVQFCEPANSCVAEIIDRCVFFIIDHCDDTEDVVRSSIIEKTWEEAS